MTFSKAFESECLYAIFLHRGNSSSWHVALYLPESSCREGGDSPLSESSDDSINNTQTMSRYRGPIFHCTNMNKSNEWVYEVVDAGPSGMDIAQRLVLGVKLADLASFGPRGDVVAEIERIVREEVEVLPKAHRSIFNCRKWALSAISTLHDFGFLDRKSTRLNSSHSGESRMPSSA